MLFGEIQHETLSHLRSNAKKYYFFSNAEVLSGANDSIAPSPMVENKQARYLFQQNTKEKYERQWDFSSFIFLTFYLFTACWGKYCTPKFEKAHLDSSSEMTINCPSLYQNLFRWWNPCQPICFCGWHKWRCLNYRSIYFSTNTLGESKMKELMNSNFKHMYEKLEIKFELLKKF